MLWRSSNRHFVNVYIVRKCSVHQHYLLERLIFLLQMQKKSVDISPLSGQRCSVCNCVCVCVFLVFEGKNQTYLYIFLLAKFSYFYWSKHLGFGIDDIRINIWQNCLSQKPLCFLNLREAFAFHCQKENKL